MRRRRTGLPICRAGDPLRVVRIIYVLGFAEGTGYHLYELITRGLSAYRYAPPVVAVFFHLLLLIDPVAGLAVLRRHRAGPMLACLTMAGDLIANWWVNWPAVYAHPGHSSGRTDCLS